MLNGFQVVLRRVIVDLHEGQDFRQPTFILEYIVPGLVRLLFEELVDQFGDQLVVAIFGNTACFFALCSHEFNWHLFRLSDHGFVHEVVRCIVFECSFVKQMDFTLVLLVGFFVQDLPLVDCALLADKACLVVLDDLEQSIL